MADDTLALTPDADESKVWWKSKTIWGAIFTVLGLGSYLTGLGPLLTGDQIGALVNVVSLALAAGGPLLGVYGRHTSSPAIQFSVSIGGEPTISVATGVDKKVDAPK